MKIKSIVALSLIHFFFLNFLHAQNIKWNPQVKIADRAHQLYLGNEDKYSFSLGSNFPLYDERIYQNQKQLTNWIKKLKVTLFRYSIDSMKFIDTTFISPRKSPKRFLNAFIADHKIKVFYLGSPGDKFGVYADCYDAQCRFIETQSLDEMDGPSNLKFDSIYKVFFADDFSTIAVAAKNDLKILDNKGTLQRKISFPAAEVEDVKISSKGDIAILSRQGKNYFINLFTGDEKNTRQKLVATTKAEISEVTLTVRDDQYSVISLYGQTDNSFKPDYGRASNTPRFCSRGMQINFYDPSLNETIKYVDYSEQTLLDAVDRLKLENIKGIDWVNFREYSFDKNGGFYIVYQEHYGYDTEHEVTKGRPPVPDFFSYYGDIIAFHVDKEGNSTQTVVKRNSEGFEEDAFCLEMKSICMNNDLYIYFNQGKEGEYELNEVILDKSLKTIFTYKQEIDSEKRKPYPEFRYARKYTEGKYIVFGKFNKKTGSAMLDFK